MPDIPGTYEFRTVERRANPALKYVNTPKLCDSLPQRHLVRIVIGNCVSAVCAMQINENDTGARRTRITVMKGILFIPALHTFFFRGCRCFFHPFYAAKEKGRSGGVLPTVQWRRKNSRPYP